MLERAGHGRAESLREDCHDGLTGLHGMVALPLGLVAMGVCGLRRRPTATARAGLTRRVPADSLRPGRA